MMKIKIFLDDIRNIIKKDDDDVIQLFKNIRYIFDNTNNSILGEY